MRASAVARLEARLSELAGAPVELERPNDPEHGDYATNVAMQLAPVRKRSPRELGEELAAAALGLDEVERADYDVLGRRVGVGKRRRAAVALPGLARAVAARRGA